MNRPIVLIIWLLTSYFMSYAEDSILVTHEIIVTQDRVGEMGNSIKYGYRLNEQYWFKVGVNLYGGYLNQKPKYRNSYETSNSVINTSLVLGIDQHSKKLKKIEFVKGINLRFSFIQQCSYSDNPYLQESLRTVYERYLWAGIGCTFGMYYCISESFSIGSEINPYVQCRFYRISPSSLEDKKIIRIDYDLFSNVSLLSLRYRW
jgi:hypothetical protein